MDGWVYDPSGSPLAGARILARNSQTGFSRTAESNQRGYFRITDLPVGIYNLEVSRTGFAPFQNQNLIVSLGWTTRADVHLQLPTAVSQVTVTSAPPLLNASATSMTSSVGRERIEESPVRTRNALDFVLMEPNVVSTRTGSGAASSGGATAAGGLPASGFSFGGMRPTSNRIAIDGMENNDEFSGGSRTELSPEIVQEFQVVNHGISAEFGGASGGSVNVVTRSGADTMHGDAFLFLQNGSLDARPPVEEAPGKPEIRRYRIGASNGAAIVRDKTFYYVAFEQEHERSQAASDIDPAIASAVNRALSSGLYPLLPVRRLNTGYFRTARAETEASGKLDQQSGQRGVLSLRYALTNNREAGDAFNNSGLTDAGSRGSSFLFDQSLAASWTLTATPDSVNTLRAQISRRNAVLRTGVTTGPEIIITGQADFGQPYQGNQTYREDHADLGDTYSWNHGRHLVQAGAASTYVHESTVNRYGEGGLFVFPTIEDFVDANPYVYRQVFSAPGAAFSTPSYGGFVQDHWVLSPRLTLDEGLRYDFQQLPYAFPQNTHNFSPRAGIAFSPTSRLVFRAGYGIFFDRYVLASLDRAIVGGQQGFEHVADGFFAANVFQSTFTRIPVIPTPGLLPSVYRVDSSLPTPYSQQASFGTQYALAKDITASANYLFVRGSDLARTRNINLLPPFLNSAQEPLFSPLRLNPAFNDIYQLEDTATSTYNGLSLGLRVMKEDFTLDTSYTYSKTSDDASSWEEQPQNPYLMSAEYGPSLFDLRHRFVLSGLIDLPIGPEEGVPAPANESLLVRVLSNIEFAPILTLESGRPVNPVTGVDLSGLQSYPFADRPVGLGRNSLLLPPLASLDLRILKAIYLGRPSRHLDLVAESFNLLNRTNVTAINPFFNGGLAPAPFFRTPMDALAGRQLQFSIDFEY